MIRINQIKLEITENTSSNSPSSEELYDRLIRKKLNKILKNTEISEYRTVRKSIDARDKNNVMEILSVDVKCPDTVNEEKLVKKLNNKNIMLTKEVSYTFPVNLDNSELAENMRPVIIGAGPAGYFSALKLAEAGFRPILFERGKSVFERTADVENFWRTGILNPESNVSFGEGGAGTFSDGKLNTGIKDKSGRISEVLKIFHKHGADRDILYSAKPHIGTDVLKKIMVSMRKRIEESGGEIHFNSLLKDIDKSEDSLYRYTLTFADNSDKKKSGAKSADREFKLNTNILILAMGHSARDTFKMLYDRHFPMEPKPFAVGLRIEHKRSMIDKSQYGEKYAALLPAADYKLTYTDNETGRAVFSFCMCPGGFVVNASSEEGCMVVNGMSNRARDEFNSNSAIVCSVNPADFGSDNPMDAIRFQKDLEERFYRAGKGSIPVQTYGDFKDNRMTESFGLVIPNIKGSYRFANLRECLPEYISEAIIRAMSEFDKKIHGFADSDSVLSGVESRTSSPVRILRDKNHMSSFPGIFLCGEGPGYAGGITSSAVDGIKTAEQAASYIVTLYSIDTQGNRL